jgi:hypothetical protein
MPINKAWIPFNSNSVNLYVANQKGVYELGNRNTDGVIRVIYIGNSITLRDRLLQHLGIYEPNISIKRYAQFFRVEASNAPALSEKLLVLEFQIKEGRLPLANTKNP